MGEDSKQQWLQSLKVGDEVALLRWGGWHRQYDFTQITGETPTRWKIGSRQFNKSDGCERGEYAKCRFVEPTETLKTELRDEAEKNALVVRLRDRTSWSSLSLETLRAVSSVLDTRTQTIERGGSERYKTNNHTGHWHTDHSDA